MRRIRLGHASLLLALLALAIAGVLALRGKLGWAVAALAAYGSGATTTPLEVALEAEGLALLQRGGEAAAIRERLERAVALDPHSRAVHLLGDLALREGDPERAAEQYRRYLAIDPSFLPGYLRLVELYEARGDRAAREEVLRRGIEFFAGEVERWRPSEDPSVPAAFNLKAAAVYEGYREALGLLRSMQEPEAGAGVEASGG